MVLGGVPERGRNLVHPGVSIVRTNVLPLHSKRDGPARYVARSRPGQH